MADVIGQPSAIRESRGQLLLLSGIGLAALLVVLALLLNGVIYTENVAARDSEARETLDVLRYEHEAIETTQTILLAENAGSDRDYATMEANLTRHLANWSDLSARHMARDAGVVWVDLTDTQYGTHIVQDVDRQLTNQAGDPGWSIVEDATAIPVFDMTVERNALVTVSETQPNGTVLANQGVFAIERITPTETDRVYIYKASGKTVIQHDDGSPVQGTTCEYTGQSVTIDFANGSVDGAACDAIDGFVSAGPATDIWFADGSNANGTYELIVNRPAIDTDLNTGPGPSPYGERLLFDATISIRYVTPELDYSNTGIVVSGGDW